MKIEGINKKLLGIACEFYGMEILLDEGWFLGKNNKRLLDTISVIQNFNLISQMFNYFFLIFL